jgi:hypothetical protein
MDKLKTVPLKNIPKDVDDIIIKEQARLTFQDNQELKKEQVVYKIIREWYQNKTRLNA